MSSTLAIHSKESAPEKSRPFLDAVEKKFGFLPNLMKVLAGSPVAIQAYLQLSELFEKSEFTPREQQLILLTISSENHCEYCVAAHSMVARNVAKVSREEIDLVKSSANLPDKKVNALVTFVRQAVKERGFVSEVDLSAFLSNGYEQHHVLEVITAIALKTISNYSNHIAKTPIDSAFQK